MKSFINNHQYNRITKLMKDFQSTLKFNADQVMVAATKDITNDGIQALFEDQPEDSTILLDIDSVIKPEDVDKYLDQIESYVYGINPVTEKQIQKLFKKEKKLKLPSLEGHKKSFYGWVDEGKKKLYLAYWLEDLLIGMICSIGKTDGPNSRMCSICGYMGNGSEVIPVSVNCKTQNQDDYHVIGFNICKDSDLCNTRIVSVRPLENLLKKVNGLGKDEDA